MSFLEHLDELRGVLVQSIVAVVLCALGTWLVSGRILDMLLADLPVEQLNFFAPSEAFMVRLKLSLVLGLIVAFPFVLYKTWSFIAPALFEHERQKIYPFIIFSSILFYVGVAFCYIILMPIVLEFLLGFGTERLTPVISVSAYFAMVARLCFAFGLVFQLPIAILILTVAGLVTPRTLLNQWRWAVLVVFGASAIFTPPDPASQVLMAIPVILLYIVSVLVAFAVVRRQDDD